MIFPSFVLYSETITDVTVRKRYTRTLNPVLTNLLTGLAWPGLKIATAQSLPWPPILDWPQIFSQQKIALNLKTII